jgi:hypothetical protein
VNIKPLKKIEVALEMKFVYGFVADEDLEILVHRQAKKLPLSG